MYFNAILHIMFNDTAQLLTVVNVKTHNDSGQLGSYCEIVCPLISRIQYANGKTLTAQTKTLFKQGDKVSITAFYAPVEDELSDEYPLITIFEGFVLDFFEGNPITIKCVDWIYNLNFCKTINIPLKPGNPGFTGKIKDLIDIVLKDTGITQLPGTIDFKLEDFTLTNCTPAAVFEHIKKEVGLNISLIGNKLYCNVASNTLNTVRLNTSVNVTESNISKNQTTFQRIKVKAWFLHEDHTKDSFEVGDADGQNREVFFYKIPAGDMIIIDTAAGPQQIPRAYNDLANEALKKFRLNLFNGTVKTKLYPFIEIFDTVIYNDVRYPDRNGVYVCSGRDGEFGMSGFNWVYKLAWLRDE